MDGGGNFITQPFHLPIWNEENANLTVVLCRCCCTCCSSMRRATRCSPLKKWRRSACCSRRWVSGGRAGSSPPPEWLQQLRSLSGGAERPEHREVQQHGQPGCVFPIQIGSSCPGEHERRFRRCVFCSLRLQTASPSVVMMFS